MNNSSDSSTDNVETNDTEYLQTKRKEKLRMYSQKYYHKKNPFAVLNPIRDTQDFLNHNQQPNLNHNSISNEQEEELMEEDFSYENDLNNRSTNELG